MFSSTKKRKVVKTIRTCTESTYLLLYAFKKISISWHNPFKVRLVDGALKAMVHIFANRLQMYVTDNTRETDNTLLSGVGWCLVDFRRDMVKRDYGN